MVEMIKDNIKRYKDFLIYKKLAYDNACDKFIGYMLCLRDLNLITFEESTSEITRFCMNYPHVEKEEK